MAQVNNLNTLAEKIYQEGIDKANKESGEILAKAHAKARQLIEDAEVKSEEIIQKSEKEADRIITSASNEIKLKTKQAIADLKEEITSKLLANHLDKKIGETFEDEEFIKKLIIKSTENWSESEGLSIQLSADLRENIEPFLRKELDRKFSGITIQINDQSKRGFVLENRKEGYFLSFTEEAFEEFLRPYFSEKIRKLLFGTDS